MSETMANKQQTAVEWLWNELDAILPYSIDTETGIKLYRAKNQALQMEREQIINAHDGFPIEFRNCQNGEEYYEQTYGK